MYVIAKIDIGAKFLESDESKEARTQLNRTLKYLSEEGFIKLIGEPLDLLATRAGQYATRFNTGLKASISVKGETYLQEELIKFKKIPNNNTQTDEAANIRQLIFISHSSSDKEIITSFIDKILKLVLKIDSDKIFCTSLHENSIISGTDFRSAIKNNLKKASTVIQIISKSYKESEVCLNEMGAAWVLCDKVIPFIVPPIDYDSVGFIHQPDQLLKFNSKEDILKFIDEEKQNTNNIKHNEIERHVKEFLESISHYLQTPSNVKTIKKPLPQISVNGLNLEEDDIVEIENREGIYIFKDEKLVQILDDSQMALFVYGYEGKDRKIIKHKDAAPFIDISKNIPLLRSSRFT